MDSKTTKPDLPQGFDMVWDDDTESYEIYREDERPGWATFIGRISAWGEPIVFDAYCDVTRKGQQMTDGQKAIDWIIREATR